MEKKLGEVANLFNGKTRPKSLGCYPVYGGNGIIGYTDRFNSNEKTIIIGRVGAYCGNVNYSRTKCWVTDNAIGVSAKEGVNSLYLYYALINKKLERYSGGSGQPLMTQTRLKNIKLMIPDIQKQNTIAETLCTVDDKILLNNQLIDFFEEYAQLLFHKWFVDFNFPDEEGKPYRDNGGEMYEVDGKMIPVGWEKTAINNLGLEIMNGDWGSEEYEEGLLEVLCIRGADIPSWNKGEVKDTPIRYVKESNGCNKMLRHGDIIIEASGGSPTQSTGRTVLIRESILNNINKPVYCSNFSKIIRPKNTQSSTYLYSLLKNFYNRGVFFHYEGKTTGIKNLLLSSLMNNFKIYKPNIEIINKFEDEVGLIMDKIYTLGKENELLEETRDLLIRKLIK